MTASAKKLLESNRADRNGRRVQKNFASVTNHLGANIQSAGSVEAFLDLAIQELRVSRDSADVDAIEGAARLILDSERRGGRVHVTGVGKSEHIARYFASLLSSTGTPAYFLHATECVHGSAGQVCKEDIVIIVSNSGATPEILSVMNSLLALGNRIIAISSKMDSPLAQKADQVLYAGASYEGGLLNLAPRTSVLAKTYVLCALSVCLEAHKGLTREQYARWHPAGVLGSLASV